MTVGPLVIAASLVLLAGAGEGSSYLTGVLPGIVLLGLGLSATVAPLTATVLAAVDESMVGVASGVNNAVARAAGLFTVAALPAIVGLTQGSVLQNPAEFSSGFRAAMFLSAGMAALGGLLAWVTIRNKLQDDRHACPSSRVHARVHCAVDSTPPAGDGDADRFRRAA